MADRRTIDELSLAELEQLVLTRRREERMRRLRERGIERELPQPVSPAPDAKPTRLPSLSGRRSVRTKGQNTRPSWMSRLLTLAEIAALVAFVVAGILWYRDTQQTDLTVPEPEEQAIEIVLAEPTQEEVLPGNPTPPTSDTPIPPQYRGWIQPTNNSAPILLGDLSEQRPTRIVIPKLDIDAPIVGGTDWEALKRGAGHHPGTANPGERGNMVITAHNDIFGELFRYLDDLEKGDTFTVYDSLEREYNYIVRTKRLVEPTEVSVLDPSPEPLATLITCHPYLIDSQRLIVQAELVK